MILSIFYTYYLYILRYVCSGQPPIIALLNLKYISLFSILDTSVFDTSWFLLEVPSFLFSYLFHHLPLMDSPEKSFLNVGVPYCFILASLSCVPSVNRGLNWHCTVRVLMLIQVFLHLCAFTWAVHWSLGIKGFKLKSPSPVRLTCSIVNSIALV